MQFLNVQKFVGAIKECADLETGKILHEETVAANLNTNKYIGSALIKMYSRLRNMESAHQIFDAMNARDVVLWNSIILGYVENDDSITGMDMFRSMSCEPSFVTYVAVIQACKSLPLEQEFRLAQGIHIHKQIQSHGLSMNVIVGNALVDMYCKCGNMEHAKTCFDSMTDRTAATWNSLIQGYVENAESLKAMDMFINMDCEPTSVTYVAVLKVCSEMIRERLPKHFCLAKVRQIHKDVKTRGFHVNVVVGTSLIEVYSRCGAMRSAHEVFDGMPKRNVVTWTSLVQGFVENGQNRVAIDLFTQLDCEPDAFIFAAVLKACGASACEDESTRRSCLRKGIMLHKQLRAYGFDSDIVVSAALVDMYRRCGSMLHARKVFDWFQNRNVLLWNTLLVGYFDNGEVLLALSLFSCMDCDPSFVTYVAALKACGRLVSEKQLDKHFCLSLGIKLHKDMTSHKLEMDMSVETALVDMYGKCGSMVHARKVFEIMTYKDVVSWTSLLLGYVDNGESFLAMEMFVNMDCEPNAFTYVVALKACSHLVALQAGQRIHALVCRLGLEEDQLVMTALVDLYGRCGSTRKAEVIFTGMHSLDTVSWTSMVVAYSSVGDTRKAYQLVKEMQLAGVQVENPTVTCILTLCSHAGLVEEGRKYLESMAARKGHVPVEHYNCMVDALSRAGKLKEAVALASGMPCEADDVTWTSLIGAYRMAVV